MPQNSLEWATWALVVVTGGLLVTSVALAIFAWKAYGASQEQSKVMAEQVQALREQSQALRSQKDVFEKVAKSLNDLKEGVGSVSGALYNIKEYLAVLPGAIRPPRQPTKRI
jgi:septal ring factor EnvC (AmiA/AmiB activator)